MTDDLRPIRTDADHEAALADVERLWGAKLGTPDGDRLDILATLIDAYESHRHPADPADPIEAVLFRMEQQGFTRLDLESLAGSQTEVAKMLNRESDLSLDLIRRLNAEWGIPADILIRPTRLRHVA